MPGKHSPALLGAAALFTAGAAAVHLAVVPDHLLEYLLFGIFFAVVGIGKLAVAVTLPFRPRRRLCQAAAVGTLGLLVLWLVSRTVGLPIAPTPWQPEAIGLPDILCVAMESVSLILLAALALRRPRPRRRRIVRTALATAPVLLLVAALTYVKEIDPEDLRRAVSVVAGGEALLSPTVTRRLIAAFTAGPQRIPADAALVGALTEREREVVVLAADGLANNEIADRLTISPATAKTHISRAMVKVGARDRAQLVVLAYRSGLVRPPGP